jgi:hypothetical protein
LCPRADRGGGTWIRATQQHTVILVTGALGLDALGNAVRPERFLCISTNSCTSTHPRRECRQSRHSRGGDHPHRSFWRRVSSSQWMGWAGTLKSFRPLQLAYSYGSPVEHPVKKALTSRHSWPAQHAAAGLRVPPCTVGLTPWALGPRGSVYLRLRRHRQIFLPAYWGIVAGCCTLHTRQTNQRKEIHLSGNRLR